MSEVVDLRDGTHVAIRAICPDDKPLLRDAFARLSPESRYRRFFRPMDELRDEDLRYLTEVDHHDHEALVATDSDGDHALGVARFIRDPAHGDRAEAAVTVVDEWQGRGLGRALLERLVRRARDEDVHRFTALVQGDNRRALTVLRELGSTQTTRVGNEVELDIALPEEEGLGTLAEALRAAASRMLTMRGLAQRVTVPVLSGGVRSYQMSQAIVVGTDGSDTALRAVRRAGELARALGAPLHVVTAYQPATDHRRERESTAPADGQPPLDPHEEAEALLTEIVEELTAEGTNASTHVCEGDPAEVIIAMAEQVRAHMIVVGNRGMTGVSRFLLGSVPNRISHRAPCDVLIVRTTGD